MSEPAQYQLQGSNAREIAADVEQALRDGRLSSGSTLPTVRDLAGRLGLSPATVASAYRTLGQRGLTAGAGRRGTRIRARPPIA
ncbi:MAG: GntR family transcriptional regulator, partial [Acidimicrobiales bacterium]